MIEKRCATSRRTRDEDIAILNRTCASTLTLREALPYFIDTIELTIELTIEHERMRLESKHSPFDKMKRSSRVDKEE
jgi:hypothetical protein